MLSNEEKEATRLIYNDMIAKQSMTAIIVSSISAVIPVGAIFYFLAFADRLPVYMLLIPGFVVGLCVKFGGGRAITPKFKAVPALFTLFFFAVAIFVVTSNYIFVFLAVPNAIIAYWLAGTSLSDEQRTARYRVSKGLVSL